MRDAEAATNCFGAGSPVAPTAGEFFVAWLNVPNLTNLTVYIQLYMHKTRREIVHTQLCMSKMIFNNARQNWESGRAMTEPAYVTIAADYARQIRTGALPAGTQLRSLTELMARHEVSKIVIIQAMQLLERQGLVRSVPRRGTFVTDHPNLVRVAPERQMEDPEETFGHESGETVRIEREALDFPAPEVLADALAITPGTAVRHTVTRATEGGRAVSISDTYQPIDVPDISHATALEETVADRIPTEAHAKWLGTMPGDLVKTVHQRYLGPGDQVLMLSDISYPRDRYDAFVFRMELTQPVKPSRTE
ncbi:GntR family transcriptional regulator [Nocardia sp. NPDC060256]|uniref:GntR family transcriptional regulator n=1 Tax=unclassified Nocardia TaxID=2637762 RepID=UPI0036646BFB